MKLSTLGKPLIVFLLFISNPAYSQDCNVYFDFDRDQLRLNDVAKLDRIVNLYKSGEQKIKIVGYTDTSGTFKYNNELSARRANRVMEYLVSGGIERNNIFTESKGELYQYGADQLYSRRVEVSFRSAKDQFSSVSEFRKSLVPQTQTFIIPGDKDIEIEGAKGTIINIEANSFVGIEGKEVSGEVKLELIEFYTMKDFFSDALSTCSDSFLLSSAGMVKVAVNQGGVELKLKDGKDIQLYFPKVNDSIYSSFNGVRRNDGSMNWMEEKEKTQSSKNARSVDVGVTIAADGRTLIITDKESADKRNQEIAYNPVLQKFSKMSEGEKKALELYRDEQMRADLKRGKVYSLINSSKLGYINCDRFINNPTNIFVKCNLKIENSDLSITSAALIFRKSNAYLEFSLNGFSSAKLGYLLPTNEKAELVVIGSNKDRPYLYHKSITLSENMNEKITLKASSFEEIKEVF